MSVTVLQGDCRDVLKTLPAESVQCCITSPPYFHLRDYKVEGQMGMESSPDAYVSALVDVCREVWRVLRSDGTLWLNIGDSFASNGGDLNKRQPGASNTGQQRVIDMNANVGGNRTPPPGLKPKDLILIPFRLALALQADGWYVRSDIIWAKPNPMPESVLDRPTRAHEYIFLLSKSERYFYDAAAIRESGKEWSGRAGAFARDGDVSSLVLPNQSAAEHRADRDDRVPTGANKRDVWAVDYDETSVRDHVVDKQRGHGRRHNGFNDRWDQMTKDEQQALGANKRDVWNVATRPYADAHFAVFPEALIEPCILAGSRVGDTVLDPFAGSGTTLRVATKHRRDAIGIELNPTYVDLIEKRTSRVQQTLPMEDAS